MKNFSKINRALAAKKKFLSLFFALLMAFTVSAKVAFLVPHATSTSRDDLASFKIDDADQDPEKRAYDWFNTNFVTPGTGEFICFNDLSDLSGINAIWIYVDRLNFDANAFDALFTTARKEKLQAFLNAGGNLFLCKQATRLEKDLVGATDGQSSTSGQGNVITPAYTHDHISGAATWGVDYRFELPDDWQNRGGHAMFDGLPHRDDTYAELIWTDGKRLTDNNCGFEIGWMGMNDIWDKEHFHAFETRNNCQILGGWANGDGCHYGGIIEFFPTGNRKGTVLMMGLAAYQWINNNAGNGWNNTQAMTQKALNYLNARPRANDNSLMEDKFANDSFFYPSNTTIFRTLHPDCEGLSAVYSIASDPNNIARIVDVQEGENTVKKLQFKAAGTVTLHIVLTENREFKAWPKGTYEYDREITFAYANADAAQDAINEDFPANGVIVENEIQMAMRLHPSVRGMDSLSYTITNHYDNTEGEAYKKTEDGVTRLYFSKSGKVLLTIRLNETNEWREEWPAGEKVLTRELAFTYTQQDGPTFPWPDEFTNGANPGSEITLPETVEGLTVTYSIEEGDNATLNGNILTLNNVNSGHVTVHASVTENDIKVTWPVGTYNYEKSLNFEKLRPKSNGENPIPMEEKLAEDFFFPSQTTTFRTLHPDCEGLAAAYSLTSDPDGIARIEGNQLQFKAAGTVNLHIVLTEARGNKEWEDGEYEYDREITFAYANPDAAQEAVEADLEADGIIEEEGVLKAMVLHASLRGLDSLSYTITNHYEGTEGEAYKGKTDDGFTRLYFAKSGKVLLTARYVENDWVEAWPVGEKEFNRVVEFHYAQEAGPAFTWPFEFETGAVGPNSVITLPETAEGLNVTYTVEGNGSIEGNVLTLANVTSGTVTVHASVTENDVKVTWPKGTYVSENTLSFHAAEVGYLLPAAESIDHMAGWYDGEQPEYNAAKWFQETYIATGKGRFVTVEELPTLKEKGIKALWVNIERIDITTDEGMFTAMPAPLKTYIQAGGNVLLTKQATRLAYLMDRIGYAPEFNAGGYSTDAPDHRSRSIATKMGISLSEEHQLDMSGHAIYEGMLSYDEPKNVYLVAPECNKTMNYCSWQDFFTDGNNTTAYGNDNIQRMRDFENAWNATVLGIQGNIYDYCLSNVVEFNATGDWQGRILTIGSAAYQWGSSNNMVELDNMKRLTSNSLAYLNNEEPEAEVYTRSVTNGNYGTICLPMASSAIEGATMYQVVGGNASEGITIEEVAAMEAGTPYIFLASADEIRVTMTGQSSEVQPANGLIGNLGATMTVPQETKNYVLSHNMLYQVDSEVTIATNRAYINMDGINPVAPAPGMRRRVIAVEHIATGNLTPTLSQGEGGKVLRDGQLFILRDGKTYNAQGQIVK